MKEAIHTVTLFGTPLNGSPLAHLAWGYPIADALKPVNPQLRMLKAWAKSAHSKQPWNSTTIILGQDDKIVCHQYAELIEWTGDNLPKFTQLDHAELVRPISWDEAIIVDFISTSLRIND